MIRLHEMRLPMDHSPEDLRAAVIARLRVSPERMGRIAIYKRATDARKAPDIFFTYIVDVEIADEERVLARFAQDPGVVRTPDTSYRPPCTPSPGRHRPVVIGMGPCGLFAGLILAEMGLRPLILERGKIVRERTKDTFAFWRQGHLNPASNAQFGEGGAGTFSDGKLYSQVKDRRFLGRKVLTEFVEAGAPEEILYLSRPHIGTFRLVSMVEAMREKIMRLGGEIRFETQVTDLAVEDSDAGRRISALILSDGDTIAADHVVLALGHSSRDTFEMLHRRGVYMEPKPFSIGVRIEHPQSVIDRARYGSKAGDRRLGAADYRLSHQAANGRTVYSFCMCPGGTVVAAASEPGRLVTNGMSQYSRRERNANAGIVVEVFPEDFPGRAAHDPLAGIAFQRHWEERAFEAGGGSWKAPAQLVGDFLRGAGSTDLGSALPSYKPGVTPTDLATCLPDYATSAIREAIPVFARDIRGFDMHDAVMTGVETRTSSPVRITRGPDFQSLNTKGLFPAGEGAGYAGGILSAAIDGIRAAEGVASDLARR